MPILGVNRCHTRNRFANILLISGYTCSQQGQVQGHFATNSPHHNVSSSDHGGPDHQVTSVSPAVTGADVLMTMMCLCQFGGQELRHPSRPMASAARIFCSGRCFGEYVGLCVSLEDLQRAKGRSYAASWLQRRCRMIDRWILSAAILWTRNPLKCLYLR